ncbi:MAG: ribbon-helix-helix protein, CopG family [Candidatus Lokiarchaeota archaeon]|nr:ribbon-helix-helix protein, CopG family [Candidatus Lokiarchaeota archaeon]
MTTISISLDEELVEWLDQLVKSGVIKNRSEAVRGGIFSYVREQLGILSREQLWDFLEKRQKKPLQSGVEAIRSVREEE